MISVCHKKSFIKKLIGTGVSLGISLTLATNSFAQTATGSSVLTKGGTSSGLPNAGTGEVTYAIFAFGVILFVFGAIKLAKSFQN